MTSPADPRRNESPRPPASDAPSAGDAPSDGHAPPGADRGEDAPRPAHETNLEERDRANRGWGYEDNQGHGGKAQG